ncbi:MAG: histidine phosphatase family protein [Clostridia bacterium]|nr:histidine phosphatase family protein [Clostridia bacterium]
MEEKFEIFYIRHGETTNGLFEDRDTCDVNLTETGVKQAELLGERFKGRHFDAVFSSPLVRAVRTAAAVCNQLDNHPEIEILPQIIENGSSYGYFGESLEYLSRYYDRLKLNSDMPLMYDNLEDSDNDKRARAVIDYFRSRFTYGQRIIVFAHGSFGNHFLPQAVEMGEGNYILSLNNTSVSKVKYTTDGKQRISFCNDFSHLRPLMPDYEFDV